MSKELTKQNYAIDTPNKAKQMAQVLSKHIQDNKLSVKIATNNYVMVEGWQFAGGLLGLFPMIKEVKELGPNKWMAVAEIYRGDRVVSTGYAICSKAESKKSNFDEYAIISMAQTRAIGKAYRNYIGWVIKMAGYESTPAEEAEKISQQQKIPVIDETPKESSLIKLVKEVKKATGFNTNKEVVEAINRKTGLQLKDLRLTEKHAQIVLFKWLESK
jgi:hypothetical protein